VDSLPGRRRFATTRWTLVVAAGDTDEPSSREAVAALCESYWWPLYAFIRRSGKNADAAKDLTQAFFTRVIEKRYFKHADKARGRFRSFLLAAAKNFLANEHDWAVAAKRGGGVPPLALEFDDGERRYSNEPADMLTPDVIYERNWASAVIADAMARLDSSERDPARRELVAALRPFLTGDEAGSYGEIARKFQTTEGALRVAVHRLRKEFGERLRETIADTVDGPDEIDDELRHLVAVMSGPA